MSIFRSYAKKSLQKNRTRTLVTVIGIILSLAMVTAVTTIITSIQHYGVAYETKEMGGWHVEADGLSQEDLVTAGADERVAEICELSYLGYAYLEDGKNNYKPYLCIQAMNEAFTEIMPIHLTEGRLPENQQEVLIPEHAMTNGGSEFTLGEELVLDVGIRKTQEGEIRWQNMPLKISEERGDRSFDTLEQLINTREQRYTVVGFYERPSFEGYTAPGYTVLTVDGGKWKTDMPVDAWFVMKHPKDAIAFYNTVLEMGQYVVTCNNPLLRFYGFSVREDFNAMLYGMGSILICIIVLGSVALIYNAFAISISERTKEFGLLLSIGATKKQMKQTIRYEALLLSVIGIPLGILAGICGIGITLSFFKNTMSFLIGNAEGVELKLVVTPVAIFVSVVVGVMTVLISAYLPMRRALKGSAIDAIQLRKDVQLTKKKLKIPGWINRRFGLNGVLAWKNFKRSKKKYRATVVSLAMSILLFVSAGAFSEYLFGGFSEAVSMSDYDLDVVVNANNYEESKEAAAILENQKVAELMHQYLYIYCRGNMEGEEDSLTDEVREHFEEWGYVDICINFIPDELFERLLAVYGLNMETYQNQEHPKALVLNTVRMPDVPDAEGDDVCQVLKQGTKTWTLHMQDDILLEIGDIVEYEQVEKMRFEGNYQAWGGGDYGIEFMYPMSMMPDMLEKDEFSSVGLSHTFYFKAKDHKAAEKGLEELLKGTSYYLYNNAENEEQLRMVYLMIHVFCLGFITLISLIAAANIFNTISTNMNQRRREFAMLGSVGMTKRDFTQMLNFECLIYGSRGFLYGFLLSVLSTLPMYYFSHEKSMGGYYIPGKYVLIAAICVFIVVYAAMLYGKSQLKKVNMVECLKSE